MKTIILFFITISLISCGGPDLSGSLDHSKLSEKQRSFLEEYNQEEGGTAPSVVVKVNTEEGGEWIVVRHFAQGEFFSEKYRSYYYAYNLENYEEGKLSDFLYPVNFENHPTYLLQVFEREGSTYDGSSGYVSETQGEWIDEEFIFENSVNSEKDLEKLGAQVEAMEIAEMEENLINYGLSLDRAQTLGKLMNSYSKIKTKRALTAREKDIFTKELTGMTFDKATSVLVEEGYDALVDRASEVNGADPEAIKELLNEVM